MMSRGSGNNGASRGRRPAAAIELVNSGRSVCVCLSSPVRDQRQADATLTRQSPGGNGLLERAIRIIPQTKVAGLTGIFFADRRVAGAKQGISE